MKSDEERRHETDEWWRRRDQYKEDRADPMLTRAKITSLNPTKR